MRIPALLLACTLLLGPLTRTQVLASSSSSSSSSLNSNSRSSRSSADDLYLDDFGSGEGPEGQPDMTFTHVDHEGSGHGPTKDRSPYEAVYDNYDDTEDGYDDYRDEEFGEDGMIEGSGMPGVFIDDDEPPYREPEIVVDEGPWTKEAQPPPPPPVTTPPPPPPNNGRGNMESPVQIHTTMTEERQVSIFAQPGILAAFIGGAVVGLLCAILLVMFIVYRMRKKDEGSYPLDEPKRMPLTSSYSPNDKEIYA